ncbi:unnamed protein product [Meloidogyne enterolobii]|uniref:Uncharacterized protein n=4 Tax=Meloidogyne TaxID=189290 RepID=A0A6V7XNS4_MELEN|nr:unnamed protein product [Meloidogyne enterolobii]CAD2200898.1 unnamed protein product [Meloidogyne enterolobii]
MELNTSYRLTRSQSLCGIRSTSAGNYPVVPRTYSITDFADYRREVLAHPITWPRVPVLRPRISTYVYRPHWTYRSHWPHSQIHFQCPPGPYEYRKDPFHWAYPYHPTWTKYRTEWYKFNNINNHRISGAWNHPNLLNNLF